MSTVSLNSVSQSAEKVRRFPRRAVIVGGIVLVALAAIALVALRMSYVPDGLDTSTTLSSEQGVYHVSYESELKPIPINQIQTWTIRVTQPGGEPVEDAVITVDGGMPQHGHGLPAVPKVTEYLGDGRYRVDGMKFNMPGWWVVTVEITRDGTTDDVTFNLMLN